MKIKSVVAVVGVLGVILSGCTKFLDPYAGFTSEPQIVKYGEFDTLRYHILNDDLIIEFHYDIHIPSMSFIGVTSDIKTNQTSRSLEFTILDKLSGPEATETIENGNYILTVKFPDFNQQTDKVIYRDAESIHEVPFAGLRKTPFELYKPEPIDMNDIFK